MIELRIPAAGDAVSEVQLIEWTAVDGAAVKAGQTIYSIESDKSVLEIEAPVSGMLRIIEQPGQIFPIGHLIGTIK